MGGGPTNSSGASARWRSLGEKEEKGKLLTDDTKPDRSLPGAPSDCLFCAAEAQRAHLPFVGLCYEHTQALADDRDALKEALRSVTPLTPCFCPDVRPNTCSKCRAVALLKGIR